ncbi:hypothetical protein OH76DRAFT_949162 [Lentinus brumalis]|uniref:Uncharacterized protein n=1 Tax=Lentinus brumalis TaxID=2498619 RepID=A0A371CZ65_9APHY|nr:hypothetical protein OH76DRAFT_949162 [Polyporus brumalis]
MTYAYSPVCHLDSRAAERDALQSTKMYSTLQISASGSMCGSCVRAGTRRPASSSKGLAWPCGMGVVHPAEGGHAIAISALRIFKGLGDATSSSSSSPGRVHGHETCQRARSRPVPVLRDKPALARTHGMS